MSEGVSSTVYDAMEIAFPGLRQGRNDGTVRGYGRLRTFT